MLESKYEKSTSWNIASGSLITTVLVWAYYTNDPVNTSKLLTLAVSAFISLGFMITYRIWKQKTFLNLPIISLCLFFVLWSLISIIFSETNFLDGFYGTWGRNTGWLAYFCFVLIFLSSASIRNYRSINRILFALYFAGVVNLVYFLFTQLGIELIPWKNDYNRILGTFGNPNFLGAFMGFFGVLLFSRLVTKGISPKKKIFDFLLLLITVYEIKLSLASQGVVVLVGGIAFQIFVWIKVNFSKIILSLYTLVTGLAAIVALSGALNFGPLAKLIYKPSVTFRGQYWEAAWNAGKDHPIFGIGFDSLGFWYGRYRTPESIVFPGPETTTNAAHNVYLDILASGGFPLFFAYICLNAFVLYKVIRIVKHITTFDWVPIGLITIWICYQTQSLISINQIGIAIWGWVTSGLILAFPLSEKADSNTDIDSKSQTKSNGRAAIIKREQFTLTTGLIAGFIGLAIGLQPIRADINWNQALRPIDPSKLESQSKSWPLSYMRLMHASSIYTANGYPEIGLKLAMYASKEFPDVWMVWDIMLKNPKLNQSDKEEILKQLRRIDPLNPNYKK